jgi:hypothetical protein
MPALAQRLAAGGRRAGEHDGGLGADHRGGADAGARLQAGGRAARLRADQHQRRAVDDARGIAGVVHMLDALHRRVLAQRGGVEAHLAHHREAGFELARVSSVVAGRMVSSSSSSSRPAMSCTGTSELREVPGGACCGGALVRAHREGVERRCGEALQRGDQVGADALRHEGQRWLTRGSITQAPPSLPIGQRLMTPRRRPRPGRSKPLATLAAARLTDSSPEAQKRLCVTPATCLRPFGVEHGGARDVGALLAHRRHAAEHHVVDQRGVEPQALLHRLQQRAQQPHRAGLVQAAVLLALAARCAHMVVEVGVEWHGRSPAGRTLT